MYTLDGVIYDENNLPSRVYEHHYDEETHTHEIREVKNPELMKIYWDCSYMNKSVLLSKIVKELDNLLCVLEWQKLKFEKELK
jgi:hypothetical protein